MDKKWLTPPGLNAEESEAIKSLCADLKAPELIAELLYRRGMRTAKQIEEFFNPSLENLFDPYLFEDMQLAVDRTLLAIEKGELIIIYGDYDVDGTTSTALLYLGLKRIGANIGFYIPHRMIDGYGLSLSSLEQIKKDG